MTKKEVEHAIGNHAEWIEHLAGRMDQLAGRMDELAAAQVRTDEQIAETNRALKESGEKTDKRISDLVIAIGEFISAAKGPKNGKD